MALRQCSRDHCVSRKTGVSPANVCECLVKSVPVNRAGNYPSGGPIARNVSVWKKAALHIDAFAPDIYLSDFDRVCEEYAGQGVAVF